MMNGLSRAIRRCTLWKRGSRAVFPLSCVTRDVRHIISIAPTPTDPDANDSVLPQALQQHPEPYEQHHILKRQSIDSERRSTATVGATHGQNRADKSTMTNREKELFSKIFQSILARESRPPQVGNHVVFTESQSGYERSDVSSTMARAFFQEYPNMSRDASGDTGQFIPNPRFTPIYFATRAKMLACKSMTELHEFMEHNIFGPFLREEISTTAINIELAEFFQSYSLLLADAMCLARLSFRDPCAAIAIFTKINNLGMESQALGAETAVYNEVLLATFEGWRDIGKTEQILQEMESDGVQFDKHTYLILKHMRQVILSEKNSTSATGIFWSNFPVRHLERLNRRIHLLSGFA